MTWHDPIVDEVRRAREAYAARFNFDLRAIYQDLKEQERLSGRKVVSYAATSDDSSSSHSTDVSIPLTSVVDPPPPQVGSVTGS